MPTSRIALAQWLPEPGAAASNLAQALEFIDAAAARGADLVVLPELWDSGCGPALADDVRAAAEPLDGPRGEALAGRARAHGLWLCAGSVCEPHAGGVANAAVLYDRSGAVVAVHRKAHLYTPGGEDRALVPGDRMTVVETGEFGAVGLAICFDGDFPEAARALRDAGARVVLHPSAYELEAETWWDRLYPARALENGQWWLSCNQCGATGGFTMLGASRVVAPDGSITGEAVRARAGETPDAALLVVDVDFAVGLGEWDAHCGVLLAGRRPGVYDA